MRFRSSQCVLSVVFVLSFCERLHAQASQPVPTGSYAPVESEPAPGGTSSAPQQGPAAPPPARWDPNLAPGRMPLGTGPSYVGEPYPPPGSPPPAPAGYGMYGPPPRPEDAPREARATDDWDLGAGIGLGVGDPLSALGGVGFGDVSASSPAYVASLERRLGGRTWLELNGTFSYATTDTPLTSTDGVPDRKTIELATSNVGALLGVRQVVATGFVDLSLFGAFSVAHASVSGGNLRPTESTGGLAESGSSATAFGAVGGLALEHELMEALAVRFSSSVVSASWSSGTTVHTSSTGRETTDRSRSLFAVRLAPILDLRFYF